MFSRMPMNIWRGSVRSAGPVRNSATTTSSNEVTKANRAPEITPGKISGRTIRKNTTVGDAPRLAPARAWL